MKNAAIGRDMYLDIPNISQLAAIPENSLIVLVRF